MDSTSNAGEDASSDLVTESHVGWVLLGGLLVSITVMVFGLALGAFQNTAEIKMVLALDKIPPEIRAGKAPAVIDLGIVVLFATPLLGVLVAFAEFVRQRDTSFILVTAALLVALFAGFAIALR